MSNITEEAIAPAPVEAPVPTGAPDYNNNLVPSPQVPGVLPKAKPEASFSISWLSIVGILAAFLVVAAIGITYLWHKRNLYKKALEEQRNFYMQNAASNSRDSDWSEDEGRNRKRGFNGTGSFGSPPGPERIVDIPVYTRDSKPRRSKDKIVPGSFRDKHMTRCFDSVQGEVFYAGVEGEQMGVRYSSEELGNIDILTHVATPTKSLTSKQKRRAESESAALLGTFTRSHTIAAAPTKEMNTPSKPARWTFRTFSLPAYHHRKPSVTSWNLNDDDKVEAESKVVLSPLTPHPSSLPSSPGAHGYSPNLTAAPWCRKPSRFSVQSLSAELHNPTFIVPPSTPPPPLPLPVTVSETPEKTLKELRRAMKQAESKWTIANYCPAPPPPPLPVPFQAPPPPPPPPPLFRRGPPVEVPSSLSDVNKDNPPSFRDMVQAPPPPPPPPRRSLTLPPKMLLKPARDPSPPPPPPPPLLSPTRKATPPPSPPPSPPPLPGTTPPASPPPPPPPVGAASSRPKLTPLTLPGRPDLADDFQEFRHEQRLSKRHQKMRPLHWDKLKPDSQSVWENISNSMELDEEMIETLFGVSSRVTPIGPGKRFAPSTPTSEKNEILDPRKAHNIAIQLRARGLSRADVCDALMEGEGLSQETLELLVKMSPTEEEVSKFQAYKGDSALLGPADRFILEILQIPSAFERLDALLYRASFKEELLHIQETIRSLELACKELKGSRTFTKLLEAVLKTGNRLNTGTYRGDAKAFKLDTLLKLADVKGEDGKTTLLHFVIQEIVKAEGARAARLAGFADAVTPSSACTTPTSTASSSSALSHFARAMEAEFERSQNDDVKDNFRKIGMDVVRGIPAELDHVRKAGALDILSLTLAVNRLQSGLEDMKATAEKLASTSTPEDMFRDKMGAFVAEAEAEVLEVQSSLEIVLASVKDISIYFYGEADTAKSTQPLKVFVVMREFLAMLELACKDVMKTTASLTQLPPSRRLSLALNAK